MEAWDEHIQAVMREQPEASMGTAQGQEGLELDPELEAHFARAYQILQQLGRQNPAPPIVDQVKTNAGFALLVDPAGQVRAISAAARDRLGDAAPLDSLREALTAGSAELLDQSLAAAGDVSTAPVVLTTEWVPRHLMARVAKSGDAGLVIEALEYRWSAEAEAMLVTSFGLSRAEVEIVRHLLAGFSLKQIANETGRSEHTVRNQSKAVLAKTGAPGQVDLIRLVVFLINQESRKAARRGGALALDRKQVTLPQRDGRSVQLYSAGDPGGRPVIFFHGMLEGPAVLDHFDRELRARGLRVLMPARPGFGQTEPVARASLALDALEKIVRALIEAEGIGRPVLLGHMAGSLFAHVLAARLRQRVSGLVCASGVAPITRLNQLSRMAPRQRVVAYTARFAPALLPTVLRAGIAQIDGKEVGEFMNALYEPGSHDRGVIEKLGIGGLLQAGYRFSVEQGHIGFATDSHFVVRDWSAEIDGMTARAVYFNGRHDPVVPAGRVAETMQDRPGIEMNILQNAGQLLLYEHSTLVLDAVERLLDSHGTVRK